MISATADRRSARTENGNTLLIVMLTIAVLATVAGNLMWSASARYHVTYQSASWQESLVAAEAGVDFAMAELRKQVTLGNDGVNGRKPFPAPAPGSNVGWTLSAPGATANYPDGGRAFPSNGNDFTVGIHGGEGNNALRTRVYVDVPGSDALTNFAQPIPKSIDDFMCEQNDRRAADPKNHYWYRIRSLGIVGVSGPPRVSPDARDNWLRRFSFVSDWRTAKPLDAGGPQVSRLVEVVAKPQTNYRNALMSDRQHDQIAFAMNLNGKDVLIDSYDSSKGAYSSATNHGEMGNLATNGSVINAGQATVKGDAMTNQGSTINDDHVTGQRRDDFYQELTPITPADMNPEWVGRPNLGTVTVNTAVNASLNKKTPTTVHLNGINLSGIQTLNVNPPLNSTDPASPSYIKIYVEGDVRVAGDGSSIRIADGVNAIIYFTGNVDLQGLGIINESIQASRLLLEGIQPPLTSSGDRPQRTINLATTEDFEGILYAPNHDLTLALQSANPTAVVTGIGTGVSSPPSKSTQKTIDKLRKDINKDADDVNKALDDQNKALAKWQQTQSQSDYANYQQKIADVAKARDKQAQDQARLDKLLNDILSQDEDHARGYNGIYGSFVARTINVLSKTHLHYDEALREAGPVNHYEIVNWFEDNTSRATVNW